MTDLPTKYRALYRMGAGAYVLLVWFWACGLGLMLADYGVSWLIWLVAIAMTLHLAWAGKAAIAPAMLGLLALMWLATVFHILPKNTHSVIAQVWAASLLELWFRSGLLILLLAFARQCIQPWRWQPTPAVGFILGLTWSGLGTGARIYSFMTAYQG